MFSVAGDGGDTQVLDAGPAASDGETDCGCGGDDEIPILYGETQALDDVDCEDDGGRDGGIKGCGETQLVDTSAGEPSERTEVLSEEEGPSSIAGTTCDASSGGRGRVEERADGGHHWALEEEEEEEEDSCDSDASTDDEDGDAGSRRRSFADIRAKAVRSSGLAASRHLASKKLDGDHSKKAGNYETGGTYIRGFGINNRAENRENVTNLYSQIGELHLEHGMDNSFWSLKDYYKQGDKDNRSSNRRARKLFDETYFEEDKSRGKAEDNAEPKGISHLLATDNFAGLSYVVSQEPGDQSQANALDVVDKFLLTNDAGSSQEFKNGLSDIVKCAPVSCMKIFEHLAEKTDRRNSIGTPSIYDWDDNLEDEGGGDFFCKRKDSFFKGTTVARKTKCQHAKIRPSITNRSRGVFENSDTVNGENKINCNKATALAHSDSRLVMQNSIKNTELHISQTQTRKNLFNPLNEESNPKALDDNLHVTDAECLEGVYNCGSDTQMADETMESLYVASPVKPDKEDRHLTPGISVQKTNSVVKKRAPQKNALLQMRTSLADPFDAEGTITRSMRKRIQATKERRESSVLDRDLSINSRMKKSQGHRFSQMKMRLEKLKLGQLTGESSERRSALESVKRKKGEGRLDKTSYKNIDVFVDQQNGDSSFSEELKNRVQDDDSAPVAHRTRHSKRAKLLEDAEKLTNVNEPDGNGLRDMQKEVKFIADASAPQVTRTVSANIGPQLGVEVRKCSSNYSGMPISGTALEGSSVSYLEDTMITQPTDKRTTEHTLGNQILDNGNRPAVSIDNRAKTDKHAKNEERKKVYIRSVSEILLKAKQHRRIDSTQMLLEYNALLSNPKLAPGVALRTRSLQKSPLEINKYLSRSVSNQAGPVEPVTPCSNSLNDHVIDSEKLTTHNSGEDAEHAEENAHLKGLSRGRIQSPSLACATPSKRKNVLSPICVAEDLPKSPKRVSATPVARELLILEPSEASTTSAHQDVRRRKYMASVRVLFSNHLGEDMVKQQKKILTRLGLAVASSIVDATHFVTDKFVRTQNMLEAIAAGKPVVTPMWLESCGQASCSLDERNYILRDTKKEKEIGFNMQVSLARACQCPILLGKTVYMTPNVKPSRQVLSSVVKAANGQAIARIGRSITKQDGVPANLLIISCLEDYSLCIPLLEKGARIFSPELLLNGIVIQKLEYSRHELFVDHVKRTRSTIWLKDKVGQFLPVNRCI